MRIHCEMSKRTLDGFFSPTAKRRKSDVETLTRRVSPPPKKSTTHATHETESIPDQTSDKTTISASTTRATKHETYPFPIADLPDDLSEALQSTIFTAQGKEMKDQPHLDLLYFQPLIPRPTADQLFYFLRSTLPFYRVKYTITRFGKSIDINTPRYTTVYGLDETSRFHTTSTPTTPTLTTITTTITDSSSSPTNPNPAPVPPSRYSPCVTPPRPIPPSLTLLKNITEALTTTAFNIVLVNYYATGSDSISFHSDDERFLGPSPSIASFSLGARRDFLLKHKPPGTGSTEGNKGVSKPPAPLSGGCDDKVYPGTTQLKLPLGSGDMILMRGETQRNWLHSIPKRTGKNSEADRGRINITMRRAMVPAGTANYYQYNVGDGPVYRWDERSGEMRIWDEADG